MSTGDGAHRTGTAWGRQLRLVGALLATVVACGLHAAARAQAQPPLTLAIADLPYTAPLLVAASQGYFEAEGLPVKILHCSIGRVCLQQLLDGQAQIATVADTPITFASFVRKDFAIVATMTTAGREIRMIARADRGIVNVGDLRGKRVGMVKGTSSHYFTDSFLLFHGLSPSDVTLVTLDTNDIVGPLIRGEVDAAGLFEPHGRDALRKLGAQGRTLPNPNFYTITMNLVSSPRVTDTDLAKLLRAVQRANTLIDTQPERARTLVATALGSDATSLAETWPNYDFRLQLNQSLITTLEAQARWALREKLAPGGARVPNYLDYIRAEPLHALNPRAVGLGR